MLRAADPRGDRPEGVRPPAARVGRAARRQRDGAEGQRPRRRLQAIPCLPRAPARSAASWRSRPSMRRRPENAIFGRTTAPGLEVLCTNPAALGGGSAKLTPIYPSAPFARERDRRRGELAIGDLPHPKTAWAGFPGAYSGKCSKAGGRERAPGQGAAGRSRVHAHARRHLGTAPDRRQHRARAAGQPGQAADSQIRLGSRPHLSSMGSPPHWTFGRVVVQFWTWPTTCVPIATTWSTSTEPLALHGATPAVSRSACSTSSPSARPSRPIRLKTQEDKPPAMA